MLYDRRFLLPPIQRSLRLRLLAMFLLVVAVTASIVALFPTLRTGGLLTAYAAASAKGGLNVTIQSLDIYNQRENGHADPLVEQGIADLIAGKYGVRMIVVTPANPTSSVIADSDQRELNGRAFLPARSQSQPTFLAGATSPAISCSDLPASTVVVSTDGRVYCGASLVKSIATPAQTFLNAHNAAVLLGMVVAVIIALMLALLFSYSILKPITGMIGVARHMEKGDLSQRVAITSYDEIGELAHALNAMADGLQRSEDLRRNMITDIAHELRTPLTNIRGYLEALQDHVIDATPEVICSLYEESSLLTRLVADLQDLSLAEAGQLCLVRCPLAMDQSIRTAVQLAQLQAASKRLSLRVDVPDGLPLVEADAGRVAQVLRNLIVNAMTHTPAGGEITVSAATQGDAVMVRVRDTGSGIEARHLPFVFERFYRVDSSRARSTGGSGLGLAIVKQLIQAHGGSVSVSSQPGHGTCFTVTLPVVSPTPALEQAGAPT